MKETSTKNLGGRPLTDKSKRTEQVAFYVTPDDLAYMDQVAKGCGFRSRSSLCSAIMERLCIGGFSGVSFIKLGWQFAQLPKESQGFYFGSRPFPPLIGDAVDPTRAEIVPFLNKIKSEMNATI